jgi:predicted nucleic acid-binding protein
MIVLDTNVLSAVMERRRAPAVLAWFERQAAGEVWLTAVTLYEARYGIDRLKPGARRDALQSGLERAVHIVLARRVLPFDEPAAREAAALTAQREKRGRTVDLRDTFIAGIVRANGATLATRNGRDFEDAGIRLVDPWRTRAD